MATSSARPSSRKSPRSNRAFGRRTEKPRDAGLFFSMVRGQIPQPVVPPKLFARVIDEPRQAAAGFSAKFPGPGNQLGGNLKKRSQHIVDRALQMRVAIILTMITVLVPAVLLFAIYLVWRIVVTQNPLLAELPAAWLTVGATLRMHWWVVGLCIAGFVSFTFALVLYYTHRIAGPVYRFRWLFDELAEGRVHTTVQLREGDAFENLAASLLRANATLASAITHLKAAAVAASQEAGSIQNPALNEQINAIQRILDRYRVVVPRPGESET